MIMSEILVTPNDHTPVDLLIFKRLKAEVPQLVEGTLASDGNRGLAGLGPFPPRGSKIVFDAPIPAARPAPRRVIRLFD